MKYVLNITGVLLFSIMSSAYAEEDLSSYVGLPNYSSEQRITKERVKDYMTAVQMFIDETHPVGYVGNCEPKEFFTSGIITTFYNMDVLFNYKKYENSPVYLLHGSQPLIVTQSRILKKRVSRDKVRSFIKFKEIATNESYTEITNITFKTYELFESILREGTFADPSIVEVKSAKLIEEEVCYDAIN